MPRPLSEALLVLLLAASGAAQPGDAVPRQPGAPAAGVLTVSDPQHVQDTMLRDGKYWGKWNFGNAPYLQVGVQPSTVYDVYRSVSLIRFDLSGTPWAKVQSARLRLYVPRNQTQMVPVPIQVHRITGANADWKEGGSEAEEELAASSWNSRGDGRHWAGAPGLAQAGADYEAGPLDTKLADGLRGQWLEFKLPNELVQSWMDDPDSNAGLLIRTDDKAEAGQSTHICSSQHWSGNGPQLVMQGEISSAKVRAGIHSQALGNRRYQLPPRGPLFERWLHESDERADRYPVWAKDRGINLTGQQQIFPYLWDIIVKAELLIPKATLPLSRITEELPEVIARQDRARAREIMEDCMKYLMVYDYGRDRIWYDSGPMVEFLSPLQVAKFFVNENEGGGKAGARGIYSQYDDGRWRESSAEDLTSEVKAQLEDIKRQLKPTPDQFAAIEPVIRQEMILEQQHRAELKKNLDRVQKLVEQGSDGIEMLQALRGMFFHHRMFLIHQSLFSMPKYSVLLENGDILGYAQWFYKKRVGQYNHERVGRQLAAASRYLWKPSPYQEAEYAGLEGCHWANAREGYTGTGYIVLDGAPSHVEWQADLPAAGEYRLDFRYSLAKPTGQQLQLAVNGVSEKFPQQFVPTGPGSWGTNSVVVNLTSGQNKIRLLATKGGGAELDHLNIRPCAMGAEARAPGQAAATPGPTPAKGTTGEAGFAGH